VAWVPLKPDDCARASVDRPTPSATTIEAAGSAMPAAPLKSWARSRPRVPVEPGRDFIRKPPWRGVEARPERAARLRDSNIMTHPHTHSAGEVSAWPPPRHLCCYYRYRTRHPRTKRIARNGARTRRMFLGVAVRQQREPSSFPFGIFCVDFFLRSRGDSQRRPCDPSTARLRRGSLA
jgi:hypothetical protein